jgi:hypothetical protein
MANPAEKEDSRSRLQDFIQATPEDLMVLLVICSKIR